MTLFWRLNTFRFQDRRSGASVKGSASAFNVASRPSLDLFRVIRIGRFRMLAMGGFRVLGKHFLPSRFPFEEKNVP